MQVVRENDAHFRLLVLESFVVVRSHKGPLLLETPASISSLCCFFQCIETDWGPFKKTSRRAVGDPTCYDCRNRKCCNKTDEE